jgi:muconate cycloisomerase
MTLRATQLDIYRTSIPMRSFEHAAASRDVAEAVVVRAAFSDGGCGWGETLPRRYVTGETIETVLADLEAIVWPAAAGADFTDAAAALAAIPTAAGDGRCLNAAACAVELACVDWALRRGGPAAMGGLIGGRTMARRIDVRVSGVLGSSDPARTARRLRLMRWYGLRDFKLKLGFGEDVDGENLRVVRRRIGRAVTAGRCTLRVDVNGGWDADSTPQRVAGLAGPFGVSAVEQPVYCPAGELVDLARRCNVPLIADESLLTEADAEALLAKPRRVWWNVRMSKNGGLLRAARLLDMAGQAGVTVVVGCMVGESSILSAAQRRLLQFVGGVRFVEGNYGRFLLAGDLTARSLRFGYGGRLKAISAPGLGATPAAAGLARWAEHVKTLEA